MSEHTYLTPEEIARFLRVTSKTVIKLAQEGTLDGLKVGDRWRIERASVERMTGKTLPPGSKDTNA